LQKTLIFRQRQCQVSSFQPFNASTLQPMPDLAHFYGKGKLLLTAEYFVMDGSMALALPCKLGQHFSLENLPSQTQTLHWRSLDMHGQLWYEGRFSTQDFKEQGPATPIGRTLSTWLQAIFKDRPIPASDVQIETRLEFPRDWGLGSSSTLISCLCQWTGADPYALLDATTGGSGYDVACAQAEGPIFFQRKGPLRRHHAINYHPEFRHYLYFVHLGSKRNTQDAIKDYRKRDPLAPELVRRMTGLTQAVASAQDLSHFEHIMAEHEHLVAEVLQMPRAKDLHFADYWGEVKSLGAWGGDFVLATSIRDIDLTKAYFAERGFSTVLTFNELFRN
jgi:mevalonate kinase